MYATSIETRGVSRNEIGKKTTYVTERSSKRLHYHVKNQKREDEELEIFNNLHIIITKTRQKKNRQVRGKRRIREQNRVEN